MARPPLEDRATTSQVCGRRPCSTVVLGARPPAYIQIMAVQTSFCDLAVVWLALLALFVSAVDSSTIQRGSARGLSRAP